MANSYHLGDLVRCTGTFKDSAGTLIDPTVVKFSFRKPDTTITTYTYPTTIVKQSVGVYYVDLNLNAEGTWVYRFLSTGTGQAANERDFVVSESLFE